MFNIQGLNHWPGGIMDQKCSQFFLKLGSVAINKYTNYRIGVL